MRDPEHNDWEDDPVWKLVDEAKAPKAGPLFVRNIMREIRLEADNPPPWWQRLLKPKPLWAGALAATAAVAVMVVVNLGPGPSTDPGSVASPDPATTPALDELVEEEMLYQAAQDPTAFSDEALVALLAD